jgi:hypothetical protein
VLWGTPPAALRQLHTHSPFRTGGLRVTDPRERSPTRNPYRNDSRLFASLYAGGRPVHHFDLYRLRGPADFKKLALEESFSAAVSLVEWSERLQGAVPPARLDVRMHAAKPVRVPPPHCTPLHPTAPHWTTAPLHPTR